MAKKSQGEQILEAIIAKGGGKGIDQAIAGLAEYKQTKEQLAAAIKPSIAKSVMAAPIIEQAAQSISQPESVSPKAGTSAGDLRDLKNSSKQLLEITKKNQTTLENILKTNSKYYEDNNELLKRLLISSDLNSSRNLENFREMMSSSSMVGVAGMGLIPPVTEPGAKPFEFPQIDLTGLPRLPGGAGKTPATGPKIKQQTTGQKIAEGAKGVGRGALQVGKFGALVTAAGALGLGSMWAFAYFTGDEQTRKEMLNQLGFESVDELINFTKEKAVEYAPEAAGAAAAVGATALAVSEAKKLAAEAKPPSGPFAEASKRIAAETTKAPTPPVEPAKPSALPKKVPDIESVYPKPGEKVAKEKITNLVADKAAKKGPGFFAKSIPVVGAIAGLVAGGIRYAEGDYVGMSAELASGALSTFGGVGTAAAIATQIGIIARDVYKDAYGVFPEQDPEASTRMADIKAEVERYLKNMVSAKPGEVGALESLQLDGTDMGLSSISAGPVTTMGASAADQSMGEGAEDTTPSSYDLYGNPAGDVGVSRAPLPPVRPTPIERPVNPNLAQGGTSGNVTVIQGGTNITNNNVMGGGQAMQMPAGTNSPTAPQSPWNLSLYGNPGIRVTP